MKKKWTAEAYLAHSGIMGMHWGKRRYQYHDGSLTPLGREHYGVGPPRGSKKDKTDHSQKGSSSERKEKLLNDAKNNGVYDLDFLEFVQNETFLNDNKKMLSEYKKYLDDPEKYATGGYEADSYRGSNHQNTVPKKRDQATVAKDLVKNDLLTENNWRGQGKRAREAADLGLRALEKLGRVAGNEITDKTRNDFRLWFIEEDQTIGLFTIADQIERGKTKEQVKKMIADANSLDYDYEYQPGLFQLRNAHEAIDFIDACYDVKAEAEAPKFRKRN